MILLEFAARISLISWDTLLLANGKSHGVSNSEGVWSLVQLRFRE